MFVLDRGTAAPRAWHTRLDPHYAALAVVEEPADFRLSEEEIERFVAEGVLWVRGCFTRAAADALLRATLDERTPAPRLGRRPGETSDLDPATLDLRDPRTWQGHVRLDVQTGRDLAIAEFAPRLWGALTSLVGPGRRITRTTMGDMWILKGPTPPIQRPAGAADFVTGVDWHIDTTSAATTLENRRDALTLLILWSDFPPGGGGTLYSARSLDLVVRDLERHPAGVGTLGYEWGRRLARECGDVTEISGQVGDVLITHAFALHAGQDSDTAPLRILENPTITVAEPLAYHTDLPDPSPVERAVIRRLSGARPRPRDDFDEIARAIIDAHADYVLPGRAAWSARVTPSERARVHALDRALVAAFVARISARIAREHAAPTSRARAAIAEVRSLVASDRAVRGELHEDPAQADFADTAGARLLRGLVSDAGQNHLVGLLLVPLVPEVFLFEAVEPSVGAPTRTLLEVRSDEGWFFVDACGEDSVFVVPARAEPAHPGAPELAAREGDERALLRAACERGHRSPAALRLPEPASARALAEALGASQARPKDGPPASEARPKDGPPASEARPKDGAWQAFLRVRARHLRLGAGPETARAYTDLARTHRIGGSTRDLVEALEKVAGRSR